MTKNIERIENLKKEMIKAYGQKGLVESLYDLKITLKKPASYYSSSDLYKLFHKKLTAHYRKLLSQATTLEEVIKLGETVSFGQMKVVLTPLFQPTEIPVIEGKKSRIIELLGDFIKLKVTPANRTDVQAQHWPFEVSLKSLKTSRWIEKTGYTFAKDTFPKSVFKNKYRLRTYPDMQLEFIFDLSAVLADAFLTNSIEKFALANQEWLQYAITHEMTNYTYGITMDVPEDETYRKDLECIRKKYNIKTTGEKEREVKYLNYRFRDAFYLTLLDGYVAKAAHPDIYRWVLPEILSQMKYIKDKTLRRIQQASDYAKSFQTKKHINKATQKAMKHNTFLEVFGYVELDNLVDLELFKKLQIEFQEFRQKVYIPEVKDHSFRIKKLGRHRAAGLYYPAPAKATIFDLSHPDSFLHEATHMMDYTLSQDGNLLSESLRFRDVYTLYVEAVEKAVGALDLDNSFRQTWEGSSKFNKHYYLQPVEVFARSYELHLYINKEIRSSFLKANYEGFVYPKEEKYLKSIADYFDELFAFFKPKEDLEKKEEIVSQNDGEKLAASPVSLPVQEIFEEKEYLVGKQLSLF